MPSLDWETAAYVATVIQGILVPVSLWLVIVQLRKQSQFTQAANTQALVELSSPFNLALIQDRAVAELWVRGAVDYDGMDEVKQYQFQSLITWWMLLHENVYYQWKRKLIDNETYLAWAGDLRAFVARANLRKHWPEYSTVCQADFVKHVDRLIENQTPASAGNAEVRPASA